MRLAHNTQTQDTRHKAQDINTQHIRHGHKTQQSATLEPGIFPPMHAARSRTASAIAAVLLSALVLFTFYILRNYGPAQAINRFHAAALSQDQLEIARVSAQTPSDSAVRFLENLIRQARAIQVQSVTQNPGEATFLIAYLEPQGPVQINWVVDQTANAGWLIDAHKTLDRNQ